MKENKTVFITGGGRGIGKEVALKFAENGYNIVTNYVSDKTDVEALKKEFEEKGVKSLILKADVTDSEAIENLVKKAIEKFESIDVLVNNAGITKDNLLMRMSEEEFRKCRTMQLFSIKSRNTWIYKKYSKRISIKKYKSKCSCSRIYRNRYDSSIRRKYKRKYI